MTTDVDILQAMVQDLAEERPERLTLLDVIAIRAMQGSLANVQHLDKDLDEDLDQYAERTAKVSYTMAEAMLEECAKRMKKESQPCQP